MSRLLIRSSFKDGFLYHYINLILFVTIIELKLTFFILYLISKIKKSLTWSTFLFCFKMNSILAAPPKTWNVILQRQNQTNNKYQAELCSQVIDLIDENDDIAYSIPMETISKHGYTEASCYLEVKCSVSLGNTSIIDESSVIWLAMDGDNEAEEFCEKITE